MEIENLDELISMLIEDEDESAIAYQQSEDHGDGDDDWMNVDELLLLAEHDDSLPNTTILDFLITAVQWEEDTIDNDDDDHWINLVPTSESAMDSLERFLLDESGVDCSICMEGIEPRADEALRLPCSHIFHASCIIHWLRAGHYCPLCRYEMPTNRKPHFRSPRCRVEHELLFSQLKLNSFDDLLALVPSIIPKISCRRRKF